MTCEHCWTLAQMKGITYAQQLREAEVNHDPCTVDDLTGRKLRAGQFWDESTQQDSRAPRERGKS